MILQTKENVEKKQALTYEEMEAEREEVILYFVWKPRNLTKQGKKLFLRASLARRDYILHVAILHYNNHLK